MPTEHAQSLPWRLGHGRFDSGQNLTRSPPLRRTELVWSTTQLLHLRLDALERPVWPHCTHFAWFSALLEPLAQPSNVLHCTVNATTKKITNYVIHSSLPINKYFFHIEGQRPLADSMLLRDVPSGGASVIRGHASAID